MRRSNKTTTVYKSLLRGELPAFIKLAHRRLEKECPPTLSTKTNEFGVPVDLISITLPPEDRHLVGEVEEIRLGYFSRVK